MKSLGILILAIGVGLCAAFGARLSDGMYEQTRIGGQVALLQGQADKAWADYCTAREAAKLDKGECAPPEKAAPAPETPLEAAEEGAEPAAEPAPARTPTYDEALAVEKAALARVSANAEGLSGAPAQARGRWLEARTALVEPRAKKAATPLPGPEARLAGWFELSGVPFLGGLALIVIGAVLGRRAAKAELSGDAGSAGPARVDFAVAVDQLAAAIRALAERAATMQAPDAAARKAVQTEIEAIQLTGFGPIVEARYQLQNRIGLAGFAAVFGPLSGAERWMNRAWSALADEHWPETRASLGRSAEQIDEATAALTNALKAA